ncbi:unnamed protein product [Rodentolepis nana]|uniref:Uncharacterized protein n=1 Tax=Rodentolepis nana TaxID=102285 RepID=A0A3P7VGT6_RODNA|nr:unnamed protein product [Rodentolepis nana]
MTLLFVVYCHHAESNYPSVYLQMRQPESLFASSFLPEKLVVPTVYYLEKDLCWGNWPNFAESALLLVVCWEQNIEYYIEVSLRFHIFVSIGISSFRWGLK